MNKEAVELRYPPDFIEQERPKRVGLILDIDEVLVNSITAWPLWLNRVMETDVTVEDLYSYGHTTLVPQWRRAGDRFQRASQLIRASSEFIASLDNIPGAREGLQAILDLGTQLGITVRLKGYLTARPETVLPATKQDLLKRGYPEATVISRPSNCPYEKTTEWKAEILATLVDEDEVLIVIDDNPLLPEAVAKVSDKIIVITLEGEHNIRSIVDHDFHHAPWPKVPRLIEAILKEL